MTKERTGKTGDRHKPNLPEQLLGRFFGLDLNNKPSLGRSRSVHASGGGTWGHPQTGSHLAQFNFVVVPNVTPMSPSRLFRNSVFLPVKHKSSSNFMVVLVVSNCSFRGDSNKIFLRNKDREVAVLA